MSSQPSGPYIDCVGALLKKRPPLCARAGCVFLGDDVQGAGEICGQRRHVGGMSNLTVADTIANILDLGDRAFMFESGMRRGYAEAASVNPTSSRLRVVVNCWKTMVRIDRLAQRILVL